MQKSNINLVLFMKFCFFLISLIKKYDYYLEIDIKILIECSSIITKKKLVKISI